jgi:hypothetical protein
MSEASIERSVTVGASFLNGLLSFSASWKGSPIAAMAGWESWSLFFAVTATVAGTIVALLRPLMRAVEVFLVCISIVGAGFFYEVISARAGVPSLLVCPALLFYSYMFGAASYMLFCGERAIYEAARKRLGRRPSRAKRK